jgi:ribosomal-protein-alanine N-acetyltransferase
MALDTPHLVLEPWLPAHILTLIEEPQRFELLTGVPAAAGLHEMFASDDVSPEWLMALREAREPDPWRLGFRVVHRETRTVIGSAGFTGPPDSDGMVEIAYGIAPQFEGRGYATEAATALIAFAFELPRVSLIRAHTLPVANASTRVLTKCSLRHVGTFIDPHDGPVWRWERHREPPNGARH